MHLRGSAHGQLHVGAQDAHDFKKEQEELRMRQETWAAATEFMPFNTKTKVPCCMPKHAALDEHEAEMMFDAFDMDSSGALDKEEVREVLLTASMPTDRVDRVLNTMFMADEATGVERTEITWEVFRLWIRREKFAQRDLTFQERVFQTLDDPMSSRTGMVWGALIVLLIMASVVTFMMESLPAMHSQPCTGCKPVLTGEYAQFEKFVIIVFSFEYMARLVTVPWVHYVDLSAKMEMVESYLHFVHTAENPKDSFIANLRMSGVRKVWVFVTRPMNIIDLLAILPFYIELYFSDSDTGGLVALRILRLGRLLRVLKLQKYNSGLTVFMNTILLSAPALSVLLFVLTLLTIFFGALLFVLEGGQWYKPEEDCGGGPGSCLAIVGQNGGYLREDAYGSLDATPFKSIFDSAWCVMATLTTVGYGDMYPVTVLGRLCTCICMVLGLLSIAMPINVLGKNFNLEYEAAQKADKQNKEDVFDAIVMGLEEYKSRLEPNTPRWLAVDSELYKVGRAKHQLEEAQVMSEAEHKVEQNHAEINKIRSTLEDVQVKLNALIVRVLPIEMHEEVNREALDKRKKSETPDHVKKRLSAAAAAQNVIKVNFAANAFSTGTANAFSSGTNASAVQAAISSVQPPQAAAVVQPKTVVTKQSNQQQSIPGLATTMNPQVAGIQQPTSPLDDKEHRIFI